MSPKRPLALIGAILLGIGATSLARPNQSSPIAISADDQLLVNVNPDAGSATLFKVGSPGPAKI